MGAMMDRRAFLKASGLLLSLTLSGCGGGTTTRSQEMFDNQVRDVEVPSAEESEAEHSVQSEEEPMKIAVTVNGVPFAATVSDTEAGKDLLARVPLTLSMEELHGNEKYCYTDESFGGASEVPATIEAGDLMVFGSDCLVLFYGTFANGGWSYQRVGKIDDTAGLAEACGQGTATVAFEYIA